MGKIAVRNSAPTDDLATLWPNMAEVGINPAQALVAIDEDGVLLGGVLLFDGGHGMLYVGELTVRSPMRTRLILRELVSAVLQWAVSTDKRGIFFHSTDSRFAAMALRHGAKLAGPMMLLTLPLPKEQAT